MALTSPARSRHDAGDAPVQSDPGPAPRHRDTTLDDLIRVLDRALARKADQSTPDGNV